MRDAELSTREFESLVELANRSPKVREILEAAGMWGATATDRERVQFLLSMTRTRGALRLVNDTIDELMELADNGNRMQDRAHIEDQLLETVDENARLKREIALLRGEKPLSSLPTGSDSQ